MHSSALSRKIQQFLQLFWQELGFKHSIFSYRIAMKICKDCLLEHYEAV